GVSCPTTTARSRATRARPTCWTRSGCPATAATATTSWPGPAGRPRRSAKRGGLPWRPSRHPCCTASPGHPLARRGPSMIRLKLHRFDRELCRHVLDSIASYLGDPAFAAFVTDWAEPAVLSHLRALDGDVEPPPMLLSDEELRDLAGVFGDEEFQHDR